MRKFALLSASLALISAQAAADVRPQDCRPVFPVVDQVAAVVPNDVVAAPAEPEALPARRFVGLPFLLPLLGLAGLIILISTHNGGHNHTVSPA